MTHPTCYMLHAEGIMEFARHECLGHPTGTEMSTGGQAASGTRRASWSGRGSFIRSRGRCVNDAPYMLQVMTISQGPQGCHSLSRRARCVLGRWETF